MYHMRRCIRILAAAALAASILSLGAAAATKDQVSLTVYNSDLALVRIEKQMEIPLGEGQVLSVHP